MNFSRGFFLTLGGCLALSVLVSGCGSSGVPKVKVKGKVTNAGQPIPIKSEGGVEMLQVIFEPMPADGIKSTEPVDPTFAIVNPTTGDFEVPAITPGKYRICVIHFAGVGVDKLEDKFARDKSPIVWPINGGEEIAIDVSKPSG